MPIITNRKNIVTNKRPEYECYYPTWKKIRDAVEGERAIKCQGDGYATTYLPPLTGHYTSDGQKTNKKYDTYLKYAEWYAASGRTVEGLVGLVFRKSPQIDSNDVMKPFIEDITLDGENIINFSQKVLEEIVTVNRVGILLDMPEVFEEGLTKEQIEAKNIRPYARIYKTEDITNWKEETINNIKQTSMVVIYERTTNLDCVDYFVNDEIEQYRVLKLLPSFDEENNQKYVYVQMIYREVEQVSQNGSKQKEWVEVERRIPLVNGEPLNYIPFWIVNSSGMNWDIKPSIINGLVDINISHYRNSANLENGLIWTGNPTPWVSGLVNNNGSDTINLGSTECLELEAGGNAGYMEFSGQGLEPIRNTMTDKEKRMALLGARIIASDGRAVETAETATIHRAGEQGVLATLANVVSEAINQVFRVIHEWTNNQNKTVIELNTDYVPIEMGAADMVGLLQMYQSGIISLDVLRWNLKKGERIPNTVSNQEMDEQIAKNPPPEKEPDINDEIPQVM